MKIEFFNIFIRKAFVKTFNLNVAFSKFLRKDSSLEEQIILAAFLFVFQISLLFSSILYFLKIETRFNIDTKLISLGFFILLSFSILKFLFRKNRYQMFQGFEKNKISVIIHFILITLLLLVFLGIAILYEFTNGNLSIILYYLLK